jgi:hypothetical protein
LEGILGLAWKRPRHYGCRLTRDRRQIEVVDAEDYVAALTLVKQVRMMLFGLLKKLDLPANRPGQKKKPMPG